MRDERRTKRTKLLSILLYDILISWWKDIKASLYLLSVLRKEGGDKHGRGDKHVFSVRRRVGQLMEEYV
jgi:hypothetical protein